MGRKGCENVTSGVLVVYAVGIHQRWVMVVYAGSGEVFRGATLWDRTGLVLRVTVVYIVRRAGCDLRASMKRGW